MSDVNPMENLLAALAGLEVRLAEVQREVRRLKTLARNLE